MKEIGLRIMTHNLWKNDMNCPQWAEKGLDCSASARSKGFIRVYKELLPDVVGCQEMSALMADELMRGCLNENIKYALLWGRDTPILYRRDKLELIDSDFSLYPQEVPGYEGCFNNNGTKSWNIAVFRIKDNGKILIFASTHLWWKSSDPSSEEFQAYSDEARKYQVELLLKKVDYFQEQYDCPVVIVGDFNAEYHSEAVQYALDKGFSSAHDIATEEVDDSVGLHYCYGDGYQNCYYDLSFEKAIDHILVGGAEGLSVRNFKRYSPEYYLPLSDHSPAYIDAKI